MKPILMLFIFIPVLSFILLALNILLSANKPDESKISPFECGFIPVLGQTRSNFNIQFYLIAMLFLIFDLEILLLFPIAVTLYQISLFGFSVAIVFFLVLTVGFILEIGSGAISDNTSSSSSSFNKSNKILPLFKNKSNKYNIKFLKYKNVFIVISVIIIIIIIIINLKFSFNFDLYLPLIKSNCLIVSQSNNNGKDKLLNNKMNDDNYINWVETPQIRKAREVLLKMYATLEGKEKEFSDKYLKHLLTPFKGKTGLNKDIISVKNFLSLKTYYIINQKIIQNLGNFYKDKLGFYLFTTKEFDLKNTYIGLTQNFLNRLETHYYLSSRTEKHYGSLYPFINKIGGIVNMQFILILDMPTYQSLWIKKYGTITPEFNYILQSFSEFQAGIYEQALLSYYKPGLNKNVITYFNFINWISGFYIKKDFESYLSLPKAQFIMNYKNLHRFNFDLYFDLCNFRNIIPMTQEWLEWFTGFIERRANIHSQYHTKSIKLSMTDKNFLIYIKNMLNLTANPFTREKVGYQIQIGNLLDSEILFSIFYNNLITQDFKEKFFSNFSSKFNGVKFTNQDNKEKDNLLSKISLSNGWLAGFIDANSSFYFKGFIPVISIISNKHYDILVIISKLFPNSKFKTDKNLIISGKDSVILVLDYLEKYPPKLKISNYTWFLECIRMLNLGYQYDSDTKKILKVLIKNKLNSN
jgi:NADH-ubiquinone oxidoreductase chain 3